MHIKVDIDIAPAEFRELMGWPDVSELQREGMARLLEQMKSGAEGYDPLSLMQPFLAGSLSSVEKFQKLMAGAMAAYAAGRSADKDASGDRG